MVTAVLAPGKTCGLLNPWLSRSISPHWKTETRGVIRHRRFPFGGQGDFKRLFETFLREQSQERIVDRTSGRSSPYSSNLDQVLLIEKISPLISGGLI